MALAIPALTATGLPAVASFGWLVASALIHVVYFVLVGLSYRHADYSVAYPVMRGSAPLATSLIGTVVVGEQLQPLAWLGVVLLTAGVLGLGLEAMRGGRFTPRSILIAAANAAVIVAHTLVDGIGARLSSNAAAYVIGMRLRTGILILPLVPALLRRDDMLQLGSRWRFGLLGGAMVTCSYGIALWAMTKAPIGVVAALRETSVLFATILAAYVLGERFGPLRWICAFGIVAGLVTLRLA